MDCKFYPVLRGCRVVLSCEDFSLLNFGHENVSLLTLEKNR